jgi:hypothetical protein
MKTKTTTLIQTAAAIVIAGFTVVSTASAGSVSATMRVSAVVKARALVDVVSEPRQVVITDDDVKRGFVDIANAMQLHVRTNARGGYNLQFASFDGPFAGAEVSGLGSVAELAASGGWIHQSFAAFDSTAALSFRLRLSSGATAGTYAWPVDVDATPVE